METSTLDGADSADDSGSSQPYTQLRGIPKARISLSCTQDLKFFSTCPLEMGEQLIMDQMLMQYYDFIAFGENGRVLQDISFRNFKDLWKKTLSSPILKKSSHSLRRFGRGKTRLLFFPLLPLFSSSD
jgi:hypothetical protein